MFTVEHSSAQYNSESADSATQSDEIPGVVKAQVFNEGVLLVENPACHTEQAPGMQSGAGAGKEWKNRNGPGTQ